MFCSACGKEVLGGETVCQSCGTTITGGANTGGFSDYSQVPFYRKNWFAILCFFLAMPILALMVITGPVYYVSKGQVKKYSGLARGFLIVYSILATLVAIGKFSGTSGVVADSRQSTQQQASQPVEQNADVNNGPLSIDNVPPDVSKLTIALEGIGSTAESTFSNKITFGSYLKMVKNGTGKEPVISKDGDDYTVKYGASGVIVNEVFSPVDDNSISIEKMTVNGKDIPDDQINSTVVVLMLALAGNKKSPTGGGNGVTPAAQAPATSGVTSDSATTSSLQCAGVPQPLMRSINTWVAQQRGDAECDNFKVQQGDMAQNGQSATVVVFSVEGSCGPGSSDGQQPGACGNHAEQYVIAQLGNGQVVQPLQVGQSGGAAVSDVAVVPGGLQLKEMKWGPNDPQCCPSIPSVAQVSLAGDHFVAK